jgi:WD40 repeat protein
MSAPATPAGLQNPFPGLRPFREDEEYLFFGRENQVDAMVNKLAATRFLAVVGNSGSGKSSLVNCGLRPALYGGLMASAGTNWRMAQFRPGNNPIRALVSALAKDGVLFSNYAAKGLTLAEIIDTTLRMSKLGLIDIVEQAQLSKDANLLIVVDQFEELFRYRQLRASQPENIYGISEDAVAFVNLLLEARQQTAYPIYIVLTMRSDFLGDCAQFPGLAEIISTGQYLVPRMTREERRAAISGPVDVSSAAISPLLLTRLVNDVGDNPDQLSILQHALNRTWGYWQSHGDTTRPLDLADYEVIGTMTHALDTHAEQAYAGLNTERKKQLCEKIFKALTDKATDLRGVRRPTTLGTLCALTEAAMEEVVAVIDEFRKPSRSFLMPPAGEILEADTVIDISHESLMRVWQRLSAWADAEAQSVQTYHRLVETSMLHKEGRAGLWQDPDLQLALDWRIKEKPNEIWAQRYYPNFTQAMHFLDASVAYRDNELREQEAQRQYALEQERILAEQQRIAETERRRAREQARSIRRFRKFTITLVATLVVAVGAAAWAIQQTKVAALRSLEALALSHIRELDLSLLLSVEALEIDDRQDNESVLLNALQQTPRLITFLRGHAGTVSSVALTADGKILASGSTDNTVILWDVAAREPIGEPLTGHTGTVWSVIISPDGRTLVSGSADNTVMLWDVFTHQQLGLPLTGHNAPVISLAMSSDGAILASGSEDGTIILWDMATRQKLGSLTGHTGQVRSVTLSHDGKILASGSTDNTIILWDVSTRQPLGPPLKGHTGPVRSVALSTDGRILASGSKDKTVILWDVATRQPIGSPFKGHSGTVLSVALSADSNTLVSGSVDKTIMLWDVATGQPLELPLTGHTSLVWSVALSADGTLLASSSEDSNIILWDVSTRPPAGISFNNYTSTISSVAVSADGKTLVSGSDDNSIRIKKVETHQLQMLPLESHSGSITSVALSADGEILASGSGDKTIILWDVVSGESLGPPLTGHTSPVLSVALSADGKILASGGDDNTIRLWDVATRKPIGSPLTGHIGAIWGVAFSADGRILASASGDRTIRLWDITTGQTVGSPLLGHNGIVRSVALSHDGRILASGSVDNTIRLWNVSTQQPLGPPLVGHNGAVRSVALSADGKILASGGDDSTIRLWDVVNLQPLGVPLIGHTDSVLSISLSADGKTLVSGGDDNTVRLWDIASSFELRSSADPWKVRACRVANRNLTRTEWQKYMGNTPYRATCPELPLAKD